MLSPMPVMMNSINVANKHMQYAALQKGQKFHSDTSDFDDPDHGSYTWNLMNVLLCPFILLHLGMPGFLHTDISLDDGLVCPNKRNVRKNSSNGLCPPSVSFSKISAYAANNYFPWFARGFSICTARPKWPSSSSESRWDLAWPLLLRGKHCFEQLFKKLPKSMEKSLLRNTCQTPDVRSHSQCPTLWRSHLHPGHQLQARL